MMTISVILENHVNTMKCVMLHRHMWRCAANARTLPMRQRCLLALLPAFEQFGNAVASREAASVACLDPLRGSALAEAAMTLLKKYRALVANGVIAADPAQVALPQLVWMARRSAADVAPAQRGWRRWLARQRAEAPKGLYIFGPVGRGKTMLMDLFFETTTFRPKRRVHFHEFMAEVHDRIGAARKEVPGDPIPHVARELAAKARCCASTRCTSPTSPMP